MSAVIFSPASAYLLGTAFLGMGLKAFADPESSYELFGLPRQTQTTSFGVL
ncbi:hypothetical protein QBC33DRAFT_558977 [Phialemonium atrogriseum]|uniref:Uncharacterized protein n=1 Tax=Phialemonium atrogriseum TaxID=1093897 RepID=A0AAJ0C2F8_9PEZI|nr:uncharacterized protein QBC33DRAFT_558977 [Phialemonium atrogriseum]KAK1767494.1 hypothetical protein QBC33DRAFT_558977 [Phialemonium atrogriseum]